jgi:hypothetical protein
VDRELPEIGGAAAVRFVIDPRLPFDWLPGDRQRFSAITLWRTVHLRDRGQPFALDDPQLLELLLHELVHVGQYARLGDVGFPVGYLARILTHGYAIHPLEVEARQVARRLLQRFLQRG